jgi:hypothetical protein
VGCVGMPDPTPQEDVEAVRTGIDAEPFMLGTHSSALAALNRLSAALERAERERDESEMRRHTDLSELRDSLRAAERALAEWADATNYAWTIICNVSEGDWTKQTEQWQEAAARFREQYHALLALRPTEDTADA